MNEIDEDTLNAAFAIGFEPSDNINSTQLIEEARAYIIDLTK